MKLSELAEATGARLDGDADPGLEISGAAGLDEARPGDVTFLANPRYTLRVRQTQASAIYVGDSVEVPQHIAALRARDPYLAYTRALRLFHPEPEFEPFIHPAAIIDPTARIAADVWIGACAVIGREVEIGPKVRLYPHATV